MPELPEVEVVRRGLSAHVPGRIIAGVEVRHPRVTRRNTIAMDAALVGERFAHVSRRGKYLWFATASGAVALVAHLGMSGQFRLVSSATALHPHTRARFVFADGDTELRFLDQRTFGWVLVAPLIADDDRGRIPDVVAHIARDPLDPNFADARFVDRVRSKQTEVKRVLLDQTVISGVGNIYADEALWRARVHGRHLASRLTRTRITDLLGHIRAVMDEALRHGGTSFDALYVNVNGESGYFDRSLNAYGQEGEPCERCGALIRREKFMNRSSFFCPRCQRAPRT